MARMRNHLILALCVAGTASAVLNETSADESAMLQTSVHDDDDRPTGCHINGARKSIGGGDCSRRDGSWIVKDGEECEVTCNDIDHGPVDPVTLKSVHGMRCQKVNGRHEFFPKVVACMKQTECHHYSNQRECSGATRQVAGQAQSECRWRQADRHDAGECYVRCAHRSNRADCQVKSGHCDWNYMGNQCITQCHELGQDKLACDRHGHFCNWDTLRTTCEYKPGKAEGLVNDDVPEEIAESVVTKKQTCENVDCCMDCMDAQGYTAWYQGNHKCKIGNHERQMACYQQHVVQLTTCLNVDHNTKWCAQEENLHCLTAPFLPHCRDWCVKFPDKCERSQCAITRGCTPWEAGHPPSHDSVRSKISGMFGGRWPFGLNIQENKTAHWVPPTKEELLALDDETATLMTIEQALEEVKSGAAVLDEKPEKRRRGGEGEEEFDAEEAEAKVSLLQKEVADFSPALDACWDFKTEAVCGSFAGCVWSDNACSSRNGEE